MRRRLGALLVSLLAVGVLAGSAAAGTKARTAHGTYATPAVGLAGQGGGNCTQEEGFGCVKFATRKTDHFVTVSIKDQSGQPVFASVGQDKATGDGPHQTTQIADICGKTSKPLRIQGGYPVVVFVWEGPGFDPPCSGLATQGTVSATFTS